LLCRDAEVLSLFAAIINKLREKVQKEVPRIFEAVFECTLTMITRNFEASALPIPLPDSLWQAINLHLSRHDTICLEAHLDITWPPVRQKLHFKKTKF